MKRSFMGREVTKIQRQVQHEHDLIDMRRSEVMTLILVCVAVVAVVVALLSYWVWFGVLHDMSISIKTSDWAAFGDFVGGILNPVISGISVVILAFAFIAQKQELIETRKALTETAESQEQMVDQQLAHTKAQIAANKIAIKQNELQHEALIQQRRANNISAARVTFDQNNADIERLSSHNESLRLTLTGLQVPNRSDFPATNLYENACEKHHTLLTEISDKMAEYSKLIADLQKAQSEQIDKISKM